MFRKGRSTLSSLSKLTPKSILFTLVPGFFIFLNRCPLTETPGCPLSLERLKKRISLLLSLKVLRSFTSYI